MTSLLLAYSFFILNYSEDDAVIVRRFRHLLPKSSTFEDDYQLSNLLHLITFDHFIKEMTWEKEVTFSLKNTKNVLVLYLLGFFFFFFFIINHLWIISLCICVIIYNNLIFFFFYITYTRTSFYWCCIGQEDIYSVGWLWQRQNFSMSTCQEVIYTF